MKSIAGALLAAVLVAALSAGLEAKEPKKEQVRFYRPDYVETGLDIPGYEPPEGLLSAAAATDTYCVVWYDFEQMDWQGWTRRDNRAQVDTFFHVDDFAGLGGGSFGRLVPLEGTKSLWCGIGDVSGFYGCGWISAPGYGNQWNQMWTTDAFSFSGILTLSYKCMTDTEPEWDLTYVEYDSGDRWTSVASYDGLDTVVAEHQIMIAQSATKLRFHFVSGRTYSDEDGLFNGDGACIIDSITVADDIGEIDFEDFEAAEAGDRETDFWHAEVEAGVGTYSGLSNGLQDYDPCNRNLSTLITFFHGSPWPSDEYPGLFETPYPSLPHWDLGQNEMVISPPIDLARYSTGKNDSQDADIPSGDLAALTSVLMRFNVYADLPRINYVFYTWSVRSIENGCPGPWVGGDYWYYSEGRDWVFELTDISTLVTSDTIQVAVGIFDGCGYCWLPVAPECANHTPAPWFDNVRIERSCAESPSWSVRRIDLFQDTFPQEVEASADPMEEFCRADMANDVAGYDDYNRIDPGDSAVVRVAAPFAGGLDTLTTGEARVYCHVNTTFLGPDGKPDLYGPQLEGTYGSYVSDDGNWTVLLSEPARSSSGAIAENAYCVDLNDSLFTRGYMIEYYFKAYSLDGTSSTWPRGAESIASNSHYPIYGSSRLPEFTCLPTLQVVPGILYVDDFDGRGTFEGTAQTYWDYTFKELHKWDPKPDRYDVCGPSSGVSNGIGAYTSVTDPMSIFCEAYEVVIYDSGDLDRHTISEGTEHSDKSNDAQLLVDWLNCSEHKVGLLVMGDQVASDLDGSPAPVALELMSTICGITLEHGSYYELTGGGEGGGVVTPVVTGVPGGPFAGLSYYAFGGCPIINSFDVLEVTGPGQYALQYPDYGGLPYYAGIFTDQLNNASQPLRTVWAGHSFMYMRNIEILPYVRNRFYMMAQNLFQNMIFWIIDSELPKATSLSQNFPNPFNPVTRVKFTLKEKGHVSMRIYDVSGRLVRVLVDEIRDAGSYEVVWDGANDEGRRTASGIYFCRMEAGDYERTLKMVQLR